MKGLEYSMWREYSPHIAGQDNSIFLLVLAVILAFHFRKGASGIRKCRSESETRGKSESRKQTEKSGGERRYRKGGLSKARR